jgi:hypothetical protein
VLTGEPHESTHILGTSQRLASSGTDTVGGSPSPGPTSLHLGHFAVEALGSVFHTYPQSGHGPTLTDTGDEYDAPPTLRESRYRQAHTPSSVPRQPLGHRRNRILVVRPRRVGRTRVARRLLPEQRSPGVLRRTEKHDDERWNEISRIERNAPCPPQVYQRLLTLYGSK